MEMERKQKSLWRVGIESDTSSLPLTQSGNMAINLGDEGERHMGSMQEDNGLLRSLRNFETWIDRKLGVEAMGVERVPEDKRRPPQILNMMFFWFSVLTSPTLIPIGMLGPILGLSVHTSVILTIFAAMTGTIMPAFTATLSPPSGLRQVAVARYAFGIWGAKICGLLNIIINGGYAVIAAVVGGQLLVAVSEDSIPLAAGIVIIVAIGFLVSFCGFTLIHHYERYAWIFALVLICVTWGQAARFFTSTPGVSSISGMTYSGACLSYFAVVFGVACSWCPIAGDYYVHYPADTSKWLVFSLTYFGQILPTIFVGTLGNHFGGIITSNDTMSTIYNTKGTGALLLATLHPTGWAKFACTMFALTFLANVIANIYSSALCIQLWGHRFLAIPRFVWCALLSIFVLALAWGGRDKLEEIIDNFLSILGYWTLAFGLILAIEHFWFRPRLGGYDLSAWQDKKRMPVGIAATAALVIGIVFSFLGMSQTWYLSPVAKRIGKNGGDVGNYLVFASVMVFYPIFRTVEIRIFKR
ncbi:purine-cytosine permease family protein [Aspergillus alliaceus]|uniref:purine-cytosine permease family protein n=1 Tax=Petromyces alliaceus TaxID=209559 RepID=UPI0012A5E407|nr:permease for cytosine/purines, uracil, thiamine, allantoin-domain-containing protein [Aspergillus alliaceus]KAB8236441.1 permease for cytosine/purines, uracil, thiamine, allantoin-domain-containing protein [Aspergillus alliaceus]